MRNEIFNIFVVCFFQLLYCRPTEAAAVPRFRRDFRRREEFQLLVPGLWSTECTEPVAFHFLGALEHHQNCKNHSFMNDQISSA